jgi:hypothetical protein
MCMYVVYTLTHNICTKQMVLMNRTIVCVCLCTLCSSLTTDLRARIISRLAGPGQQGSAHGIGAQPAPLTPSTVRSCYRVLVGAG